MVKCKVCYEYRDNLYKFINTQHPEIYPIMACEKCGNDLVECCWIYEDEYEGEW